MKEFTLPIEPPAAGETVTFKVEWGDGTSEVISYNAGNYAANGRFTHEYIDVNGNDLTANEFEIKIYPLVGEKFGRYWRYVGNESYAADSTKLKEIKKWGCFEFAPTGYAFNGCSNLNISATDTTHQQPVIPAGGLISAFRNCSSLNPVSISAAAQNYFNDLNTELVTSLAYTFYGCTNFNTDIGDWGVSGVSHMSSTFQNASNFNQDLSNWDMDEVAQASFMFAGATAFNKNLNGWNMENVVNTTSMFASAHSFNNGAGSGVESVGLTWQTNALTHLSKMFIDATSFNGDISGLNTSQVGGFHQMFQGATSFNNGGQPLSIDTGQATNMSHMFYSASNFNQSVGSWNTTNVTTMDNMFNIATAFNQDLSNWDITNVSNATNMFLDSGQSGANAEATNTSWQTQDSSSPAAQESESTDIFTPADRAELKTAVDAWVADEASATATYGDINTWNTSNITDMHQLFQQKQTFHSDIGNWDVSNVTNMSSMFSGAYAFNRDISSWDVSSVTNMENMFNYTYAFNQNLNLWDTSSVTNMKGAFDNAFVFNGNIGTWDTSNVTTMDSIFRNQNSTGTFNQDISMKSVTQNGRTYDAWDTGNVTDMNHAFYGQASFDQPIGNWDTSKVTNMSFMFGTAYAFNQPLNSWDVISVTSMNGMFYDATAFDQPLFNWSTDNVSIFEKVFRGATNFNQPIGQWNTDSATSMEQMFEKATNFNQDIGSWNTEFVTKMDSMFKEASAFNQDLSGWDITSINSASNMFLDSGQSGANAEATNTSWQTQDSSSPAAQESQNTLPMEPMIINIDLDLPNNSGQTNNDWGFIHQAIDPVNTAFTVDWGDGAVDTYTDNGSAKTRTHTYATGGQKQVKITGGLTSFGGSGGNTSLYGPKVTSIASWGELPLTSLAHACYQCKNIQSVPNSIPSTVTNLNNMFDSCYDFNDPSVSSWDTINVVGMAGMFRQCHNFNQSLNSWEVSNVLIMNQMFAYCRVLTQSFSNWNPAKVNNMSQMFQNQASSTRPVAGVGPTGLGSWDVGKVENFSAMFEYCAEDFNPDVTNWNVSSATNLQTMFAHTAMNRSLASWDVSNVQYMHALFRDTSPSVNLGLSNWNTSSVTDTSYMFMGVDCSQIGSLFTSGGMLLTTTSSMFSGATVTEAQAGEIATWHTSALTTANGMFSGTSLTTSGYDAILNGWATASAGEAIPSNINFSAGDSQYSPAAASSRNTLASSGGYNWTIVDGGPNDNWIRVGSVYAPAHSAYGSNAMEDWRLASWNDEDIWRFQQQMPGEDITYNGIVYSGGATEKTLNTSLISAVGSYNNASLGGTTNGGSHSRILVKQTENGNYSTLPGSPSKDYLIEIKVGGYIRWGASDPGVSGKLEESETAAFTLDDSAWPNSVGDGWYFINSHNAATGNNKVFKVNSQGQITQVINCADIFSSGYNIPVYTPPCVNVTSTTVSWSDLNGVDFSLQGGVGTAAWYHYVNVGGNQEFKIEWGSGSRWELLRKGSWAGAQWELLGHNLGGDNPLSTAWSHSTGWPAGSITVVACA